MKACRWIAGCTAFLTLCSCVSVAPTPIVHESTSAPRGSGTTIVSATIPTPVTTDPEFLSEGSRSVPTSPPIAVITVSPQPAIASTASRHQASRLEPFLSELVAAYRAGDRNRLAEFGGNPHVDLAAGTVRVIVEMDRNPEARPGTPTVEVIITETGQRVEIHHAPPVEIRPDLAAAIAVTGALYETATGDLVQVVAPFSSLEALAALPDVRIVRLPYPAGR